jgi:hypothetical protein
MVRDHNLERKPGRVGHGGIFGLNSHVVSLALVLATAERRAIIIT